MTDLIDRVTDEMERQSEAGYYLRCEHCGLTRRVRPQDMRRIDAEGWPRCCAETMVLRADVSPPTPAEGRE